MIILLYDETGDIASSDSCSSAKGEGNDTNVYECIVSILYGLGYACDPDKSAVRAAHQCLTRKKLSSLFICFRETVQDKTLVLAWVRHQLILNHFHQELVIHKS